MAEADRNIDARMKPMQTATAHSEPSVIQSAGVRKRILFFRSR